MRPPIVIITCLHDDSFIIGCDHGPLPDMRTDWQGAGSAAFHWREAIDSFGSLPASARQPWRCAGSVDR